MITNFQKLKGEMYNALFQQLNDKAIINNKYRVNGMFYAPTITPNIGSLTTEIVEPQFIIKAITLKKLNEQLLQNTQSKLKINDLIFIENVDESIEDGELFKIIKIEPDNYGLITLILRKTELDQIDNEDYYYDHEI